MNRRAFLRAVAAGAGALATPSLGVLSSTRLPTRPLAKPLRVYPSRVFEARYRSVMVKVSREHLEDCQFDVESFVLDAVNRQAAERIQEQFDRELATGRPRPAGLLNAER